jgi:hypothetical protein
MIRKRDMADPKGTRASTVTHGTGVHAKNTINLAMEDLIEEDCKEIERDL